MFISFHRILFTFYFQPHQIFFGSFGFKQDWWKLEREGLRQKAQWPLQAGYPGLAIKNLNEYVSLFSHCLVNIQNYQGIEILGIKSPVYITRFDVAWLEVCSISSHSNGYTEQVWIKEIR